MIQDVMHGVAQAEGAPRKGISQQVFAAVNQNPCRAAQVGSLCGLSRRKTASYLASLARRGRIRRVGYGLFAANDPAIHPVPAQALARPQPVRDQILAFLTEPRQAFEVAAHTGRRTATITGHMRAMVKLGLVERVGYGRYALAGPMPAPLPARALVRPHPVGEQVLGFLDEPRHVREIAAHLQRPMDKIREQLRAMQRRELVRCIRPQVFARISGDERHSAHTQEAAAAA